MTANEWVMSLDNPTRARYVAHGLWKQGLRASDRDVIQLCHGYTDHEMDVRCSMLQRMEETADNYLRNYNPDLGF